MTEALTHAEVLGRYAGAFVDELVAAGLEDVCLCPGSRSTPLALTFARHPKVKVWTHLDERSCAYFALGMAKVRRHKPVAILCSSGTAAVNFAPAVVEAYHARVPLIVLTADRPPELQDVGANQTIDQVRLYGSAVKWFVQMQLPDASDEALRYVRMVAARAVRTSRDEPCGPVHFNFPFREPLVPAGYEFESDGVRKSPESEELAEIGAARAIDALTEPPSALPVTQPEATSLPSVPPEPARYQRGVIVCGPDSNVFPRDVTELAVKLGFPMLADPLSDIRSGPHYGPNILGAYDSFLRSAELCAALVPDYILRFGDPPTSKPLAGYLQRYRNVRQVLVTSRDRWPDPDLTAGKIISHLQPTDLCKEWSSLIEPRSSSSWLESWRRAEAVTRNVLDKVMRAESSISEPSAFYDLEESIPGGYMIFAGNSMPVRDLDTFYAAGGKLAFYNANRGTSGIDGVISTALGIATITYGRIVLVIGDLSFYHDMNGLLAAKRFGLKATIVLLNNDGGGIFSFLPQNDDQEHFEALFGTPHGLDFAPVAELYGLGWQRVTTRDEYKKALCASFEAPGVNVIELKTDRVENLKLHQRIWQEVASAVTGSIAK